MESSDNGNNITQILIKYRMMIIGYTLLFISAYYTYYSIGNFSLEPFIDPNKLILMFDFREYLNRPADLVKIIYTVIHFYLAIGIAVLYFVLVPKLTYPFPSVTDNGTYIFMIDANRLHILRLKESSSKLFVWNKKAYFLPDNVYSYNNNAIIFYTSNMSISINSLVITKEDIESMIKELVNYTYSLGQYYNKVSIFRRFYPRDILKRRYVLIIDKDENTLKIQESTSTGKGAYSITRFISCDILVKKSERYEKYTDEPARLIISDIEIPVVTEIPVADEGSSSRKRMLQVARSAKAKNISYGLNIINPHLTYDIMRYRKVMTRLHTYFIGTTAGRMLPWLLIILAVILAIIFIPSLTGGSNPITPQQPQP